MANSDLKRDMQSFGFPGDEWAYYEEPHGLHLIHKPKMKPPVTYTLFIPWKKLRDMLKRKDKRRRTKGESDEWQ